jgi:hypothetical protein
MQEMLWDTNVKLLTKIMEKLDRASPDTSKDAGTQTHIDTDTDTGTCAYDEDEDPYVSFLPFIIFFMVVVFTGPFIKSMMPLPNPPIAPHNVSLLAIFIGFCIVAFLTKGNGAASIGLVLSLLAQALQL